MSRPYADADVFRAVAHPIRRRILDLLRESERPVHEIGSAFSIAGPTLARHLGVLRSVGLVRQRRVARSRIYSADTQRLREVVAWLSRYDELWKKRPARPDRGPTRH